MAATKLNWDSLSNSALQYVDGYIPPTPSHAPVSSFGGYEDAEKQRCEDDRRFRNDLSSPSSSSFTPLFDHLRRQLNEQRVSMELLAKMAREESSRQALQVEGYCSRLEALEAKVLREEEQKRDKVNGVDCKIDFATSDIKARLEVLGSQFEADRDGQANLNRRLLRLEGSLQGYATPTDVNNALRALVDPLRAAVDAKIARISADVASLSASAPLSTTVKNQEALEGRHAAIQSASSMTRLANRMTILEDALAGEEAAIRRAMSVLSADVDDKLSKAVERGRDVATEICTSLERRLEGRRGDAAYHAHSDYPVDSAGFMANQDTISHRLSGLASAVEVAERRASSAEAAALRAEASMEQANVIISHLRGKVVALEDELSGMSRAKRNLVSQDDLSNIQDAAEVRREFSYGLCPATSWCDIDLTVCLYLTCRIECSAWNGV